MKILQLTVHYAPNIGGVETHLTDLVSGLTKRDNNVFVLTYRPLVAKASWELIEQAKRVTILRLPWLPGFFYKFNASPVIEFVYLTPGLFVVTPFVLLFFGPSAIHAHGLIAGFIGVFWAKIFRKTVVVSTHSLYHFPKHGMYTRFARWIFSHADKTLCLSDASVTEIRALGVQQDKVKRFTYWIDMDVFKKVSAEGLRNELGIKDEFVVLFVGRLIIEKGVRELLAAAQIAGTGFRFVIVGDGPLAGEIQEAAMKEKNIIFKSKIDNTLLPEYYSAADVVIVPSVHDEGFGRVIIEALACGTPVIGSNRGAIPEAMDISVGELITITPDEIVKALRELQKDLSKMKHLTSNTRKFALRRYSEKNVEEILTNLST